MLDIPTTPAPQAGATALAAFVDAHPRLFVLTGAGCSTGSGIPDYRDALGRWKRPQPVTYQAFTGDVATRKRYWARSLVGWRRFGQATPNAVHHALVRLEQQARLTLLLTQNVDRLHQAAGQLNVIDLHGRLDRVRCLDCGLSMPRTDLQDELLRLNPDWATVEASDAPDGDADLEADFAHFEVPACPRCAGMLKPDVVFFGEGVPRKRVDAGMQALDDADAMLVVGSSLMVYSGFRFARAAARTGKPLAAVNLGRTRADDLLQLKIELPCDEAFSFLA
ncbi:NAD-dependent protein deacetylase [Dyella sp. A6]|uniref:NAD-dependent protein deacetylase n=1 Tax=Dyella aluminiiresistens TaxID=3069105 RepID=UPI002E7647DA|nr:NAD-dependent protein deacetylase [Dyella sp. A6]